MKYVGLLVPIISALSRGKREEIANDEEHQGGLMLLRRIHLLVTADNTICQE